MGLRKILFELLSFHFWRATTILLFYCWEAAAAKYSKTYFIFQKSDLHLSIYAGFATTDKIEGIHCDADSSISTAKPWI